MINLPLFSIRTYDGENDTDVSGVTDSNPSDLTPKNMYVSPKELIGRPDDTKLLRCTYVPEITDEIRCNWISSDENICTVDESGQVNMISPGKCKIIAINKKYPNIKYEITVKVKDSIKENEIINIDLDYYEIVPNDESKALQNIKNISFALKDLSLKNYKKAILPENTYWIDCENGDSIQMASNIDFDITNCIIKEVGNNNTDSYMVDFSGADNCKLINGTLIGDAKTHNYGYRFNESGDQLEYGSFYSTNGLPLNPAEGESYSSLDPNYHNSNIYVRTKDFIEYDFPTNFIISPLWDGYMNTTNNGRANVYYYDENENYLGCENQAYLSEYTFPENTKKIKISFRSEKNLVTSYFFAKNKLHVDCEFGTGVKFNNLYDSEVNGTIIADVTGDCSSTLDKGISLNIDGNNIGYETRCLDNRWINCDLSHSRRQGISFIATGENYLIKNTTIHEINGIDPQCGIDFEAYGRNEYCLFDNCNFYKNKKADITNCFSGNIEIKNSNFDGNIAIGRYNDNIHDNIFTWNTIYDTSDDLYIKDYRYWNSTGINSPQSNNISRFKYSYLNNNIIYGSENNKGRFSYNGLSYLNCNNNKIFNSKIYITDAYNSNVSNNEFVDSNVNINCSNVISGYNFKNVSFSYSNGANFEDCIFNDLLFDPSNKECLVNNCTLNNVSFTGYSTNADFLIKNSIINNSKQLTTSGVFRKLIFENVTLNLSRQTIFGWHVNQSNLYTKFKNCNFIFDDSGDENTVINILEKSNDQVYFEDCDFKSNLPVKINSNYITNCTTNSNIILGN